nr:l-type lectin-domain containing receptor kinase ix.1 [Quercus suber]
MNDAITFQGDAFTSQGVLELTKNQLNSSISYSVGRASYAEPVQLWDASTGRLTDFTTHFSFIIKAVNISWHGDGLSFFIAPFESNIPNNSSGGYLALFSAESANKTSQNQIVAVEFDSFQNYWDPSDDHVGINVNSIVSATNVSWNSSIKNGSQANARISYNSTTKNLSVFLTYANNPVFGGNSGLSYIVDLRSVLPEWGRIGFSAATGNWVELHSIQSWSFYSSLETKDRNKKNKPGLWIGITVGFGVLSCGLGLFWFIYWIKRVSGKTEELADDIYMDYEFEKGTGPRRFTCHELICATNNFAEGGKLGEGGFGGVYKGF